MKKGVLILAALLAASPPASAATPRLAEYEVKAAFLYNFAKFVEWPPGAFGSADGPFRICLMGDDPFGSRLEELLAGKTIHDRALSVKRIGAPGEAGGCQLLFVGRSEEGRLGRILAAVGSAPVLTVGDTAGFARRGGMIGFTTEDKKVRFAINQTTASAAGLKISSQLLKLARTVK